MHWATEKLSQIAEEALVEKVQSGLESGKWRWTRDNNFPEVWVLMENAERPALERPVLQLWTTPGEEDFEHIDEFFLP